jgi:hypothetical protein
LVENLDEKRKEKSKTPKVTSLAGEGADLDT